MRNWKPTGIRHKPGSKLYNREYYQRYRRNKKGNRHKRRRRRKK